MSQPVIASQPRRSCEENMARRAWASARFREQAPARQLTVLLAYPLTRTFYLEAGQRALKSQDAARIADALQMLEREIDRERAQRQKMAKHFPLLIPMLYPTAA